MSWASCRRDCIVGSSEDNTCMNRKREIRIKKEKIGEDGDQVAVSSKKEKIQLGVSFFLPCQIMQ